MTRIMIVDDERSMREFLEILLRKEGYGVSTFGSAEKALESFIKESYDLAIVDLKMPGMGGIELLKKIKKLDPETIVIVITAYASVESAVEAMKAGAYDYFIKPFNVEEIKLHIRRALKQRRLEEENRDLKLKYGFNGLVGTSHRMRELYRLIMNVAPAKTNILITGESGTGKELVARAIHTESPRKAGAFVAVNCGAIPENLIESELFGYEKGAFTGAHSSKEGLVELADGGTLFLDEITELPVNLQVKLLRFIQDRYIRRIGGREEKQVDIRLIAATNRDIDREVREGRFREDLYYRINVIRIDIPPLRERREDIPHIAMHFVEKYDRELGKNITGISEEAMSCLVEYHYPGNVRELENAIERAVALEMDSLISPSSLPPAIRDSTRTHRKVEAGLHPSVEIPPEGVDMERLVEEYEKGMLMEAMRKAGGVKKEAARLLGISFRSMRYKLSKYYGDKE